MLFPKWIYISSGFQEKLKNHEHTSKPSEKPESSKNSRTSSNNYYQNAK